jgi:thiamine-phosphate diphosphorylase
LSRGAISPIYAITDRHLSGLDSASVARVFFEEGIRTVQVREKDLPAGELLGQVLAARGAVPPGAALIVNDRVDIARIVGCGVHLGQEDLPAERARELLGAGFPIGISTHEIAEARRAFEDPAPDYVAFGPIFETSLKARSSPKGLEALARVAALRSKPLVAIGGIGLDDLSAVWEAGADSAAMITALNGPDLRARSRRAVDLARRRFLPRKIWLVGFMGSGKTTLGRQLSRRLDLPFFDLDREIEAASGKTVRAIFESEGEAEFRRRERAYVEGAEGLASGVFAAGGGTFMSEANRRSILRSSVAVYLDVPFEILAERVLRKPDRPLFQDALQARRLLEEREPFYRMAPLTVKLSGRATPEAAAEEILRKLDERLCVI